ncbi:MAG TPA: EamA family transporter [Acidimicrobiia bacterium]|jgi:drug/metabolite transporter (DMT)-like permease
MNSLREHGRGFLFVVAAASLWGTDALFRYWLAFEMVPSRLVFLEHLVLVVITVRYLWTDRAALRRLDAGDWLAAFVIGAGASALATVLFTRAFTYGDPTTPLLLQKMQPLIAVLGAWLILKEKLLPRFGLFLTVAVIGAYLVAFQDPFNVSVSALVPALLALGAAALWGLGTVLGRRLAPKLSFQTLTALRFGIGLPAAAVIMSLDLGDSPIFDLTGREMAGVVALALVPGLLALLLYYRGLRSTPASAATIGELAFPITATIIGYVVFNRALAPSQWLGVVLLVGTITTMTWLSRTRDFSEVGVLAPQPLGSEA